MMKRVGLAAHPSFISEETGSAWGLPFPGGVPAPKTQNHRRRFFTCPNLYWK